MGHTNSTVNYNLPQFVGSDKPSWLSDVNGAFLAIDTAIAAAKTQADSAAGGVAGLQTVVGGHTTQIGTLTDTVTAQGGTLNAVTALIGNGTPTTTDQTIIGAINELAAIVEAGEVSVTADGVKTNAQLFDALFALVDLSKVSPNTKLIQRISAGNDRIYTLTGYNKTGGNPFLSFVKSNTGASSFENTSIDLHDNGSIRYDGNIVSGSATFTNASATVPTSGVTFIVKY